MTATRRSRLLPLVLAPVLATACGSTVAGTTSTAAGGVAGAQQGSSAGDGLGGTATGVPGSVPGVTSTAGAGPGGGVTAGGTAGSAAVPGGSTTGYGAPGSTAAGGSSAGLSGPGVTAKELYVGLIYDENAGAVNEAAGIGSITSGDSKANSRAIIDDINKHGGVGGRKLVPVYARFDSTSANTVDSQYAAICQQFTHDNPRVFAVLGAGTESYRTCLTKAGVSILSADLPQAGAADFARYPGFVEQGYPNVDRLARYHVQPLVEQKYFTPWDAVNGRPAAAGAVKVGILTYDDTTFGPAVDRYLVPSLKKLGYTPEVAKISDVDTASDYGAQSAAVKSAQLRFASAGVTHVISFEANGGLSLFFLTNARSQHYYPRYGINSASGFQALLDTGAIDKAQMEGTIGYGWIPGLDVAGSYKGGGRPYYNANAKYCLKVMTDAGIQFDSSNAEAVAFGQCASLYLLKAAADRTPRQITLGTFIGAVESLGATYQAAGSLGQTFARGRRDPADKAYHWRYFSDCGCFHYEGGIRTVP
jgi:hypothetical protein